MSNEVVKQALDVVTIGGGLCTTVAYYLHEIINPILTAILVVITIVYTYYRIQDLRRKRDDN